MKTKLFLFAALLAAGTLAQAQLSIPSTGVPVTVNFTGYAGLGFDTAPSAGRLDADNWAVTGMSDGNRTFGSVDTLFGGDFAKGITTGDIFSGGLYAYDASGDIALLVQPTSTDWSPGSITLRLQNNTGGSIAELAVAYDLIVLNNEDRSNSFNFSYSTDDITYNAVSALDYTSVELQDTTGAAVTVPRSTTLAGLAVLNGGFVYLRWSGDDLTGGGSRDEFALDNISATASAGGTVSAFNFGAASISVGEGAGAASIALKLSSTATCSVDITVADVTATNGVDFTAPALSTSNFTSGGATSVNINIPIAEDLLIEGPETFTLTLSNATAGCIIGAVSVATVTIDDNDAAVVGACQNLYFSEYLEGSSNNKAFEIYNPTSGPVDLSAYSVQAFNNGATTPTNSLTLSGILAAGDVYVIANPSADSIILAQADVTSTVTFINGDDAVILFNGGDTIDAIGIVGVDPGTNWAVGTGFTSENTLVRKPEVNAGQNNWTIGATEWLVFPADDFSFIGSHTADPCALTCNSANIPTNQTHTNLATRVQLNWDPIPGAVACQVKGKRLPSGPQPSVNVTTAPYNTTNVPYAVAGAGTTWTWQVRCACNVSPIDASAFTAFGDTFSIPVAREMADLDAITLFPNPATDQAILNFSSDSNKDMSIEVSDIMGRIVSTTPIAASEGLNSIVLNVSDLTAGIYFVRIDGRQTVQFSVAR